MTGASITKKAAKDKPAPSLSRLGNRTGKRAPAAPGAPAADLLAGDPLATDVPGTDALTADVLAADVPVIAVLVADRLATDVPGTDALVTDVLAGDVPATAVPATAVPATAVLPADVPATAALAVVAPAADRLAGAAALTAAAVALPVPAPPQTGLVPVPDLGAGGPVMRAFDTTPVAALTIAVSEPDSDGRALAGLTGAERPAGTPVPGGSSAAAGQAVAGLTGADLSAGAPKPGAFTAAGPHPVEVAGLLHELTAQLLSADDMAQALDRLASFTAGALTGVLRCSITLITEGEPLRMTASGRAGQALDDLQYAISQGPGLDAARTRSLITAQNLAEDVRWPELADCAKAQGMHSVAAIPLDVRRSSVGSVSVFVARPDGIEPDLVLTAMAIVSQAEILLGELGRRAALAEGATVDRAAGVIIAQRGCGVREAYEVLRDTGQRLGMDRRAVAERLIAAAARVRTPDA